MEKNVTTLTIILTVLAGAAWRRNWGDVRPSWAFPGFRAAQAVTGFTVLLAVCILAGHPWWSAAIRSGLALGFLTAMAQSIPHVWAAFDWIDGKLPKGLPKQWPFDGWTTYAEATSGAIVFGIAVAL